LQEYTFETKRMKLLVEVSYSDDYFKSEKHPSERGLGLKFKAQSFYTVIKNRSEIEEQYDVEVDIGGGDCLWMKKLKNMEKNLMI